METELTYSPGEISMDTGFHGVKLDFNYGARVLVPEGEEMRVRITDRKSHCVLFDTKANGVIVSSQKKYYIEYRIEIWCGEDYFCHDLDLNDKKVMVFCPSRAIGDVIAWIPYVEKFRKVHNCQIDIIVGNHIKEIMKNNYKGLNFLTESVNNGDYYATYYIGVFFPVTDREYQPVDFRFLGLQRNVAMILGLPLEELQTHLECTAERQIKESYVCIAVQSTTLCKTWNNRLGWIEVIEYLKKQGYRVLCIDKDRACGEGRFVNTIPFGCEDFTGDVPLQERINMLKYADFFIGGSSGLAWIAWATGTPVIMISGFTLPFNEFYTPYRIINYNSCNACWHEEEFVNNDYGWCPRHKGTDREFECTRAISTAYVIETIERLRADLTKKLS